MLGSIGPALRKKAISLRASFWFIPSVIVCASLVMALVLIELDSHVAYEWAKEWPRLFGAGAEGSRGMLSSIAGSTMTMMGLTFSMTLVTLSLASSQYTSRILRNFIRNRATQTVLGLFAGIFTYCLVVLRTIRGGELEFIPNLSIFIGFVLALLGVGVIVFFIHHIASSIQASNIISDVALETIASMKNLYAAEADTDLKESTQEKDPNPQAGVLCNKSGYVQTIDEKFLCDLATRLGVTIFVDLRIGDFVVSGMPLVNLSPGKKLSDAEVRALGEAFSIQRYRTIEQDPLYGIRQIVDIALKALSPGINDTTTALVCIDYLTSILSYLVTVRIPGGSLERDGKLLLVLRRPCYADFFREAFTQIAKAGTGNLVIQERILSSIETILSLTDDRVRRAELIETLDLVSEVVDATFKLSSEISGLRRRIVDLRALEFKVS